MLNFKAVPTGQFIAGFPGFSHEFRLAIEFSQLSKRPGCFRSFWGASRVLESLPFGGAIFGREGSVGKRLETMSFSLLT